MERFNVTITSQATGKVTKEYRDVTMNDVLLIVENSGNDQFPVDVELLDNSQELNSDSYIYIERS